MTAFMVLGVVAFGDAAFFDSCTAAFGLRPRFAAVCSGAVFIASIFGVATGVGTALDFGEVLVEEIAATAFWFWQGIRIFPRYQMDDLLLPSFYGRA